MIEFEKSQEITSKKSQIYLPKTASQYAEKMEIYVISKTEDKPNKNYYKVIINTGYSGRNASETDEIMDGYNYTQVLDQVKIFEFKKAKETLNFHRFLDENLPGDDVAWAKVISAKRISETEFQSGISIGIPGIQEGVESNNLKLLVSIDSAYGYFGLEHLEKQPITFRIDFWTPREIEIEKRQELGRLTSKLIDKAFGYGINGRNQFDAYLAEALSDLERSPDADEHIQQSGMDAPRTIEYMNHKLYGLLTKEDITFIREFARAERVKTAIKRIQNLMNVNNIGTVFGNAQISGQKNPIYLEHTADTMNVIVSMIPNDSTRAAIHINQKTAQSQ